MRTPLICNFLDTSVPLFFARALSKLGFDGCAFIFRWAGRVGLLYEAVNICLRGSGTFFESRLLTGGRLLLVQIVELGNVATSSIFEFQLTGGDSLGDWRIFRILLRNGLSECHYARLRSWKSGGYVLFVKSLITSNAFASCR